MWVPNSLKSKTRLFVSNVGNPRIHTAALAQKEKPNICQGEPSLQNALETAKKSLR